MLTPSMLQKTLSWSYNDPVVVDWSRLTCSKSDYLPKQDDRKTVVLSLKSEIGSKLFFYESLGLRWLRAMICLSKMGPQPAALWRNANFGLGLRGCGVAELKGIKRNQSGTATRTPKNHSWRSNEHHLHESRQTKTSNTQ